MPIFKDNSMSNAKQSTTNVIKDEVSIAGAFGLGKFQIFEEPSTWTVPAGITSIRIRCFGGGGTNVAGGTATCLGISATGGSGYGDQFSTGGIGTGGTLHYTGGKGGKGGGAGGGAAATIFGNGGDGSSASIKVNYGGGGGYVGEQGAMDITGTYLGGSGATATQSSQLNILASLLLTWVPNLSIDYYRVGGGGGGSAHYGGNGAMGSGMYGGCGGVGHGNGGYGSGGLGGGQGYYLNSAAHYSGGGGGGFAMGVKSVTPDQKIDIVVGNSSSSTYNSAVIIEW